MRMKIGNSFFFFDMKTDNPFGLPVFIFYVFSVA